MPVLQINSAVSSGDLTSISAVAADYAKRLPLPMPTMPDSISIQLPLPSSIIVISGSLTIKSAYNLECILFVLHIMAKLRQARMVCPGYFLNSLSNSSIKARQSAADPAKPQTMSGFILRSFLAVFLNTVLPREIYPSDIITTWSSFRTLRTVVD